MRYDTIEVKNLRSLLSLLRNLSSRPHGMPGVGVVWGYTGFGKTTAAALVVNRCNGVFVRALATWTPGAMLSSIMRELDAPPLARCADMVHFIVEQLNTQNRPLFIDEADYLVDNKKLIESLRDIHDLSTMPLVLLGMKDFQRKLQHREQFAGRVSKWIEFAPASLEDARLMADGLVEDTHIADDLLKFAVDQTRGGLRGLVIGLKAFEDFAVRRSLKQLDLETWGRKPIVFTRLEGEA